jgi:hypothetical protein
MMTLRGMSAIGVPHGPGSSWRLRHSYSLITHTSHTRQRGPLNDYFLNSTFDHHRSITVLIKNTVCSDTVDCIFNSVKGI